MRYTMAFMAALAVALTPFSADAQVGVKGGASFGNVSNSGVLPGDVGTRTGFAIGVSAFTPGPIGLGLEGFYAQRGVTGQEQIDSRELEYVDLPLLLRAAIPLGAAAPYAFAGPQVSYELHCSAGADSCPDSDRPQWPTAGVIGGGLAFGERMNITIEGRYIYGLSDLRLETVSDEDSYRERSFALLAGIAF